ncbi:MAG TPA: DUF1993 domain-containing protein [Steroidobacteraceae bacterium]|jgi:hypothetical protein|nr:DUF1993 domain-containing protein [Steroidobacteraceae bacterium]
MSISIYAASVGVYTRLLTNLGTILDKAAAYAEERKIEPTALLHARLAPDMHHLIRQVQIATDMVKGTVARLAGVEPPKYEDNEATFADLKARIAKTLDFIKTFKPEQFEGAETRAISIKLPHRQLDFVGTDYLLGFGTPNVYFHYTMVYALLRNNGLAIGKGDYLA